MEPARVGGRERSVWGTLGCGPHGCGTPDQPPTHDEPSVSSPHCRVGRGKSNLVANRFVFTSSPGRNQRSFRSSVRGCHLRLAVGPFRPSPLSQHHGPVSWEMGDLASETAVVPRVDRGHNSWVSSVNIEQKAKNEDERRLEDKNARGMKWEVGGWGLLMSTASSSQVTFTARRGTKNSPASSHLTSVPCQPPTQQTLKLLLVGCFPEFARMMTSRMHRYPYAHLGLLSSQSEVSTVPTLQAAAWLGFPSSHHVSRLLDSPRLDQSHTHQRKDRHLACHKDAPAPNCFHRPFHTSHRDQPSSERFRSGREASSSSLPHFGDTAAQVSALLPSPAAVALHPGSHDTPKGVSMLRFASECEPGLRHILPILFYRN